MAVKELEPIAKAGIGDGGDLEEDGRCQEVGGKGDVVERDGERQIQAGRVHNGAVLSDALVGAGEEETARKPIDFQLASQW